MQQAYEDGLVQIYKNKIDALAVKAEEGKDVQPEVSAVVEEAAKHFAVVATSTEVGNLRRFNGMLKLAADVADKSSPERRATFEYASRLVAERLPKA